MKRTLLWASLIVAAPMTSTGVLAASFNYHGTLRDADKPANGNYDLQLTLYSSATGGNRLAGPITLYNVAVHNGSFNTPVDFDTTGAGGGTYYLDVQVKTAGASEAFAALDTRSPVSPSGSCPTSWELSGNAGLPSGSYLGTVDATPLLIQTDAQPALRISAPTTLNGALGTNIAAGYSGNEIDNVVGATIAGGGGNDGSDRKNLIQTGADFATIGGGWQNQITGHWATISGGDDNIALGYANAIGGGHANSAGDDYALVAGGDSNTAEGAYSSVIGGKGNYAGGTLSLAAGHAGHIRDSSETGTADGDQGTFMWSDSFSGDVFTSSASHEFLVRAHGGVGINTAAGPTGTGPLQAEVTIGPSSAELGADLYLLQNSEPPYLGFDIYSHPDGFFGIDLLKATTGSYEFEPVMYVNAEGNAGVGLNDIMFNTRTPIGVLTVGDTSGGAGSGANLSNGGVWTNASSRTLKDGFASVDVGSVLEKVVALPVQTWFYKVSHAEGTHIGPMAEDFAKAFGLGPDDKHIATGDESGVTIAAIQGLNQKLEVDNDAFKRSNEQLQHDVASLHAQLESLAERLARIENR